MKPKNNIHIRIVINQEHLDKLQSVGIKNISEVIRRFIDKTPIEAIKTA